MKSKNSKWAIAIIGVVFVFGILAFGVLPLYIATPKTEVLQMQDTLGKSQQLTVGDKFEIPDGVSVFLTQELSDGSVHEYTLFNGASWETFVVLYVKNIDLEKLEEVEAHVNKGIRLDGDLVIIYQGKELREGQIIHRFSVAYRWYWPF